VKTSTNKLLTQRYVKYEGNSLQNVFRIKFEAHLLSIFGANNGLETVFTQAALKPDETTINSYVRYLGQSRRSARFNIVVASFNHYYARTFASAIKLSTKSWFSLQHSSFNTAEFVAVTLGRRFVSM
jgi:hypothetical protein